MTTDCYLPPLEICNNLDKWEEYENLIYSIFKADFIDSYPKYKNVRVSVKHYPYLYGKEEAFFHTTCKNYIEGGQRNPDLRRCERIRWIRAFIENICNLNNCNRCAGIKTWVEPYKNRERVHILIEEKKYMVVLEHRPQNDNHSEYYLLITAFFLDYDNALEKQLKQYEKSKNM